MEKRSPQRIQIYGQCSGKMVLVEHIEVRGISAAGIKLKCLKRVNVRSAHRIKIQRSDIRLTLQAEVTRSSMKGTCKSTESRLRSARSRCSA